MSFVLLRANRPLNDSSFNDLKMCDKILKMIRFFNGVISGGSPKAQRMRSLVQICILDSRKFVKIGLIFTIWPFFFFLVFSLNDHFFGGDLSLKDTVQLLQIAVS